MATGTRYSYTDTGNTKRAISDVVHMIDWKEAPLLRLFGFGQENVRKFKMINWPSTKAEWIEDTLSPFTSTIAEDLDDSETGVDVATGTGSYFRYGDVIMVDSEKMLVTSVSTDTLTVVRSWGDPAAAAHSNGATLTLVTRAMNEGATYTTGHTTVTTQPYNYTQIISEAASVSKTELAMTRYGIADALDYQVAKLFADGGRAGKLAKFLQRTFYWGERVQRTSSANVNGSMGGFSTFVTTHVTNLSSAALQRSDIHKKIRDIRDAGGQCDTVITGSWGVEKITSMYDGYITMTQSATRGGSKITSVQTPHGEVELIYDWMCPAGYMYFVDTAKVGWIPMRPFERTKIAEQGDFFVSDVVGEFTFILANEKSHGLIYGFSTTS